MDKYSEYYRHQCEVRQCIKWRRKNGKIWLIRYLEAISSTARKERLKQDIWNQWHLGNRGNDNEWYE
jgi:REP element-mobilizing transposase RayT